MRCAFNVEGSDDPPWMVEVDVLLVAGARTVCDARSYVVLEVDWYGPISGYTDQAEMALVTVTEIEATPAALDTSRRSVAARHERSFRI